MSPPSPYSLYFAYGMAPHYVARYGGGAMTTREGMGTSPSPRDNTPNPFLASGNVTPLAAAAASAAGGSGIGSGSSSAFVSAQRDGMGNGYGGGSELPSPAAMVHSSSQSSLDQFDQFLFGRSSSLSSSNLLDDTTHGASPNLAAFTTQGRPEMMNQDIYR